MLKDAYLVADVAQPEQFASFVASLRDDGCVDAIFEACLRPVIYSRHHSLKYKGEYRIRADLRSFLEGLRLNAPEQWDTEECDFALSLYALSVADVGLDDLVESVDTAAVRKVLLERHAAYAAQVAAGEEPPAGILALARRVAELRSLVGRTHDLYSIIDGKAWFRTEGLIARERVDVRTLTPQVAAVLDTDFPVPTGDPVPDRLRQAARDCIAAFGDTAPLLRAVMAAILLDPVLRADHVTLTCPIGAHLDSPEAMTTSDAFFTETQLRDAIELEQYRDRLGHESAEQLQRTIRARMLKLKRGAIRSLYGPGCLQGSFVEKHGGHMIFRNEDAHYRGHQSIGCSTGGRASFSIRYRSNGQEVALTPMVGDLRVVRFSHDAEDLFTADELVHEIRYAEWVREIVEETFRLGRLLRDDTAELAAAEPVQA